MSIRATLRRTFLSYFLSRPQRPWRKTAPIAAIGLLTPLLVAAGASHPEPLDVGWQRAAPLPLPRTEVAAAVVGGRIAVVGGFVADGSSSSRVDVYTLRTNAWSRLPDLPVAVNHAMAASFRGRLYVVGGYAGREPLRAAYVLDRGRWRALPRPPEARAAAGAAVVGSRLYVVGGVGPGGLAERMLVFDLRRGRWTTAPGPRPREHLAVTAAAGVVIAAGGRLAGIDTNLAHVEAFTPRDRRWRQLPPVPHARGGTGAAAIGSAVVSVGGEEPSGSIASVYVIGLDHRGPRWQRAADLPTPRHGLGVVALGGRVYAIGGGPRPGLFVSGANEYLPLR